MAKRRTFKDYVAADGTNEIRAWLDRLPKRAKAKINNTIALLEASERLGLPETKALKGTCAGLYELRVRSGNVQYRPLFCYGLGGADVTILVGAIEKGDKFVPLTACATALRRRAELTERGRTRDHDFG